MSKRRVQWITVVVAALLLFVCFTGFYQLQVQQQQTRQQQVDRSLTTAVDLVSGWFEARQTMVRALADSDRVRHAAVGLSTLPADAALLMDNAYQSELQVLFAPLIAAGELESYRLVDNRGIIRAASDSFRIAGASPLVDYPTQFAPLWQGQVRWLLPYTESYPAFSRDTADGPRLLLAAPVGYDSKLQTRVDAALVLSIRLQSLEPLLTPVAGQGNRFIRLRSRQEPLLHLGLSPPDYEVRLIRQEQTLEQIPLTVTSALVLPPDADYSNAQLILLGLGGLSLVVLLSFLVLLMRDKDEEEKSNPLAQLLIDSGREGFIQLSPDGVIKGYNVCAALLLSGRRNTLRENLQILLTECALGLHDEGGKPFGDLMTLLRATPGERYYAWWTSDNVKRLLAFSREGLSRDNTDSDCLLSIKDVTQSRQQLLRLQREGQALNYAGELVFWVSRDGRLASANETACQQLGYSSAEISNLTLNELDTGFNPEAWQVLWSRLRRGELVEHEGTITRRNGAVFPAEVLMRYYSDGFESLACVFMRDISKRKRLESDLYRKRMRLTEKLSVTSQELEVREAENEALIESLPDLLVVFNARFEVLSFQQPKGAGIDLELVNGQSLFSLFSCLEEATLRHRLTDPVHAGQARYFTEITLSHEARHYPLQTLELRFARTGTHKILLLIRDITDRKREEYFRQFNNRLLLSISEIQTRFICNQDKKPNMNQQLEALVQLSQSECGYYWLSNSLQQKLGCPAIKGYQMSQELMLSEHCEQLMQERINQVMAQWRIAPGQPVPRLLPLADLMPVMASDEADPDCDLQTISNRGLLVLPVVVADQPVMCFSLILPDYRRWVAETRLFEPWLSTCAALLTAYESDTERQWAEKNLKLEKERAEFASQAKTQFLSRMSHEFRTPLNAILGFGHLLQEEPDLSEEQAEQISQIVDSGEAMLTLVDDVLDLAQLERQTFSVDLERVSLTDMATACISEMLEAIEQADLRFEADLPAQEYFVRADARRLRQTLLSLLNNAIRYNNRGGLIRVKLRCSAAFCELAVEDTGQGIPQDFIDRLFMPFEAGEGYLNAEGLGNGLAIARHAIEAMGGQIRVHSRHGEGSCFTLLLPQFCDESGAAGVPPEAPAVSVPVEKEPAASVVPAVPSRPPQTLSTETASDTAGDGARFSILYVEDDPSNRNIFRHLLQHIDPDIRLQEAPTAEQGISSFIADPPDLMFLDMHLGAVSGGVVLTAVRSEVSGAELPVIAVSGNVSGESIDQALDEGFDDYLCKPVSLEALTSIIRRYTS